MLSLINKTGPPGHSKFTRPGGTASAQAETSEVSVILRDYVNRHLSNSGVEQCLPEYIDNAGKTVTMHLGFPKDSDIDNLDKKFTACVNLDTSDICLGSFFVDATVPWAATESEIQAAVIYEILVNHKRYYQMLAQEIDDMVSVTSLSSLTFSLEYHIGAIVSETIRKAA